MKRIIKVDPNLTVEDYEDIMREPVVVRVNGFTANDVRDFEDDISAAHSSGQPIIPIIVDSFGGSSYGCMAMVSAIENCRLPVATIVTSKAMSAGAILFAFGTEGHRYMDPNAILMLHDMISDTEGKIDDIKADARHVESLNTSIYKRMAKHLGQPENYFSDLIKSSHVDLYVNAKDAKKHKIANVLKVPSFEINVKLEYKFGV